MAHTAELNLHALCSALLCSDWIYRLKGTMSAIATEESRVW